MSLLQIKLTRDKGQKEKIYISIQNKRFCKKNCFITVSVLFEKLVGMKKTRGIVEKDFVKT